ncbi:MAG: GNAT family N-acetyltransferase [Oscillospiraceae bacterium]
MELREIRKEELGALLTLYTQLHANTMPRLDDGLLRLWDAICEDNNHHIIVAVENEQLRSSCVLLIVPNLTHSQRPYALIENVITDPAYRNRGLASSCLAYAKQIAAAQDCYKIMLMTGSKEEQTLRFYRKAGYNSADKTAFVQWL